MVKDFVPHEWHGTCPICGYETSFSLCGHDPRAYELHEERQLGDMYSCDRCSLEFTVKELEEENDLPNSG